MVIRTIPSVQVLFYHTRTRLGRLNQFKESIARRLYAEAARQELLPAGPLVWVYNGADGKPGTLFTLEIALPVQGHPPVPGLFSSKYLPDFVGASAIHRGAREHLFETYDRLMDELELNGKKRSGICREQYLLLDFNNEANNLIEVLVGIKPS